MSQILLLALLLVPRAEVAASEDTLPPSIVHEPCEQYKKGYGFEIRARFLDDSAIFDPKVIYRSGGDFWRNVPFVREQRTDDFKAFIRAKDLKGPLEYFIEAFDENGNGPARYGSPEAPVKVLPALAPEECRQIIEMHPMTARPLSPSSAPPAAPSPSAATPGDDADAALKSPVPPPAGGFCSGPERPFYCQPWVWGVAGAVVVGGVGATVYLLTRSDAPGTVDLSVIGPDPTNTSPIPGGR